MLKQYTNPMTIELTDEQFKNAAILMRQVTTFLNTCNEKNKGKTEVKDDQDALKEFEYSAFLEQY